MTATVTVDDAIDMSALSAWLRVRALSDGEIENPVLLAGGTQNLLLRFRSGGRDMVLRRPPLHPRPKNNELILREATVLKALATTDVPHPRLLAVCDDAAVLGSAVFYLMEAVEGFNPGMDLPDGLDNPQARQHIMIQGTHILASIGALDHEMIGLGGFGNPTGFLDRQVGRWLLERDKYLGLSGYDATPLPGFDAVRDYLAASVPPTFRAGLMHGDYHLGNLIAANASGDVVAVVDWEMSTIGDPLLDLGRYLAMWPDEHEAIVERNGIFDRGVWASGVVPAPETVIGWYCDRFDRPVEGLNWYVVMGCFKLGIILEGTYARSCAGLAPREVGTALHRVAEQLFQRASRLVGHHPREMF
jgi:aminoglycoside phosphotransferase (APT) family kinase protein